MMDMIAFFIHILGVIILTAILTHSPRCMSTCFKCPGSAMKQLMISPILTYYQVGIGVVGWIFIHMMNFCLWWKGFANNFLGNKYMFQYVVPATSWMIRVIRKSIPILVGSSTPLPMPMFITRWHWYSFIPRRFSNVMVLFYKAARLTLESLLIPLSLLSDRGLPPAPAHAGSQRNKVDFATVNMDNVFSHDTYLLTGSGLMRAILVLKHLGGLFQYNPKLIFVQ